MLVSRGFWGTSAMPLDRLPHGSSFSPEEGARLNLALEITLRALHLVDRNDPITETIAKKIIKIGRSGLNDPAEISDVWWPVAHIGPSNS
jgi:hypothetical protein